MNQYADLINKRNKSISVAEARYIHRYDSESPCVQALPPVRDFGELVNDVTTFPGFPPREEFLKMNEKERNAVLNKVKNAVICLPYYQEIEEHVDMALVDSYERRSAIESNRPFREYTYNDKTQTGYCHMEITELSDAPTGFCLLGRSGCGKSTGINSVLRKYPKLIIHNPGTLRQYVQIPILLVHMSENNNFSGLYQSIGQTIDKILDNNTKVYEIELGRKGDSLSVKFHKLCDLIRIFHIGMLIIDEIELIEMKKIKEGTIETFMSLSNQTGIAIASIGTEDAFHKLFKHNRITRRMGNLINADEYCSNPKSVYRLLASLYGYLPDQVTLSQECMEAYYMESGGTINYLSQLFVSVTKEVTRLKSKGKPAEITPELIHKIAAKSLANKKALDKQTVNTRIVEDEEYSDITIQKMFATKTQAELAKTQKASKSPEKPKEQAIVPKNYSSFLLDTVKIAIEGYPGKRYSHKEIESAFQAVLAKIPENDARAAINATVLELQRRDKNQMVKASQTKKRTENLVNLAELQTTIPVSSDI